MRPAAPDDAPALCELAQRAYAGYVEQIGVRPAPMDEDYQEAIARATVLIAQSGATIAGMIVLSRRSDHLLVENVAVAPEHQHGGIGRALLARAEDVARELGCPELRLYTNAAMHRNRALYARLGYRETGRRRQARFDRVYFAKHLER